MKFLILEPSPLPILISLGPKYNNNNNNNNNNYYYYYLMDLSPIFLPLVENRCNYHSIK